LSQMSLLDRARLAAMIEVDGDESLRTHLLGAVGRAGVRGGSGAVGAGALDDRAHARPPGGGL
jgi:hypothetical protein